MNEQEKKERHKACMKAYYQAHKEEIIAKQKSYNKAHKEEHKEYLKAWREAHKEEVKAYNKSEVNSLGQTKQSIRSKSQRYLKKYGNIIKGYEIHHCCTYTEPYKFIYCPIELHRTIHLYLKAHGIDADSNHYEQIKHLLDDTCVKFNVE